MREPILAYGTRRRFTDRELAEAIRLDPSQIKGLGPSLAALKAMLESVGKGGAYLDDSQIDDLRVVRGGVVEGGSARIEIREIGTDGTP